MLPFLYIALQHRLPVATKTLSSSQLGSTALGIQTSDGILLAVEKKITSTLMEPSSVEKILEIDAHIGLVNPNCTPLQT